LLDYTEAMSKVTRRELAAAASASALVFVRRSPAQAVNAPAAPGEELNAARNQNQQIAGQLDKFPLPMDAEPSTIFKP